MGESSFKKEWFNGSSWPDKHYNHLIERVFAFDNTICLQGFFCQECDALYIYKISRVKEGIKIRKLLTFLKNLFSKPKQFLFENSPGEDKSDLENHFL
jgi:hypothetical protein